MLAMSTRRQYSQHEHTWLSVSAVCLKTSYLYDRGLPNFTPSAARLLNFRRLCCFLYSCLLLTNRSTRLKRCFCLPVHASAHSTFCEVSRCTRIFLCLLINCSCILERICYSSLSALTCRSLLAVRAAIILIGRAVAIVAIWPF